MNYWHTQADHAEVVAQKLLDRAVRQPTHEDHFFEMAEGAERRAQGYRRKADEWKGPNLVDEDGFFHNHEVPATGQFRLHSACTGCDRSYDKHVAS